MIAYLIKRILLIIPTLIGVLTITFALAQFAPGGPVERIIAQLSGTDVSATSRIGGGGDGLGAQRSTQPGQGADSVGSKYRGAQGLDKRFIEQLEKQFGFDKPWYERYWKLLGDFAHFDFGKSYFRDVTVVDLIKEKLPVSISLGLWMLLASYAIAIPLGIRKAVRDGEPFDTWSSGALVLGYAVPGFLFAVLLIVLFAGASFFQWFPRRGLHSDEWTLFLKPYGMVTGAFACGIRPACVVDYFWHLALPLIALAVGAFTTLTFLTKNSFLDEIRKQYVTTARAKGLSENRVLYGHVFRNAMLIVISGMPSAFVHAFFTGSLLIETIFSLDGLGLLGFESLINRDYPVVFATVYIYALMGMVLQLVSDIIYTLVDPRIDFETREV
ncbi:MAG: microcin C ABC transporter permease YejB [Hyphomicrobiaceae bacterium]